MEIKRVFKVLSEEIKYENPWFKVREFITEKDGKQGLYGVVDRSDSVELIIESEDQKILFVRQYRFPTDSFGWELPAGGIDDDETPIEAARRELKEETGIVTPIKPFGSFNPVPGLTPQKVFVFKGKVTNKQQHELLGNEELVDEIVDRKFFNYKKISELINQGEITNGFTLCSLALLKWNNNQEKN